MPVNTPSLNSFITHFAYEIRFSDTYWGARGDVNLDFQMKSAYLTSPSFGQKRSLKRMAGR